MRTWRPGTGTRRMMMGAGKLPDWIAKLVDLRRDVVVWPLASFRVGPKGAHGAWRASPAEGWCPYRGGRKRDADPKIEAIIRPGDYPCRHYGADLQAPAGSKVFAPHDGWILYSGPATKAPFGGYGPGAILIAHHDIQDSMWERGWKWATGPLLDAFDFPEGMVSGRYSLLGHVVPVTENFLELGDVASIPLPEDVWDSTKTKPNKDHWRKLKDGTVVMMTDADAVKQSAAGVVKRWVNAGDHIGYVSEANHVHWEIRLAPLADKSGRIDPVAVWQQFYNKQVPTGSSVDEPEPVRESSGGGGAGILLLLAAVAFGKRKRAGARRSR